MSPTRITLSLDNQTTAALVGLATRRGVGLDAVAHELLMDGLSRCGIAQRAELTALLAEDFEKARSWPELQGRLRLKGFDLRGLSGDLTLVAFPTGDHLLALRDLNVEEAVLIRRFGRSFPNTARRWDWDLELDRPAPEAGLSVVRRPGEIGPGDIGRDEPRTQPEPDQAVKG